MTRPTPTLRGRLPLSLATRSWAAGLAVLTAIVLVAGTTAAPGKRPTPLRIAVAAMVDVDRDARADGVRLTYSRRIRHAADRDGRYPFAIVGYRIRSVGAASGRSLVIRLVERAQPDPAARPVIRYRRTSSKPVVAVGGGQAVAQIFRGTRPHGHTPAGHSPTPPPSTTTTTPSTTTSPTPSAPAATDSDHDGTPDAQDCAPKDPSIHPGAPDLPDLNFVDSNCDGIDGDKGKAVFVSPSGSDVNPGTMAKPKRTLNAAVLAAAAAKKDVYAAAGLYERVDLVSGVGIYGGYAADWSSRGATPTVVNGGPEAALADGDTGVTIQLVILNGIALPVPGACAYGLRAIDGSSVALEQDIVSGTDARAGANGAPGSAGAAGGGGGDGVNGDCDGRAGGPGSGGAGGRGPAAWGGDGGGGGCPTGCGVDGGENGGNGAAGEGGAPGGAGGNSGISLGDPGQNGTGGAAGGYGTSGSGGSTGTFGLVWVGNSGTDGFGGAPGRGGGGGGGGGAQTCGGTDTPLCHPGDGNSGGGGGAAGTGGAGGKGASAGGGSFGIYLWNSAVNVIGQSMIRAGRGGAGGTGGDGGIGGSGGAGGHGGSACLSEVGAGGSGGRGGNGGFGGAGGGGGGGPSIAIFKGGTSTASLSPQVTLAISAGGAGGPGGNNLAGRAGNGQPGISSNIYP